MGGENGGKNQSDLPALVILPPQHGIPVVIRDGRSSFQGAGFGSGAAVIAPEGDDIGSQVFVAVDGQGHVKRKRTCKGARAFFRAIYSFSGSADSDSKGSGADSAGSTDSVADSAGFN